MLYMIPFGTRQTVAHKCPQYIIHCADMKVVLSCNFPKTSKNVSFLWSDLIFGQLDNFLGEQKPRHPTRRFLWKPQVVAYHDGSTGTMMIYCFSNNHVSGKWLYLKGKLLLEGPSFHWTIIVVWRVFWDELSWRPMSSPTLGFHADHSPNQIWRLTDDTSPVTSSHRLCWGL